MAGTAAKVLTGPGRAPDVTDVTGRTSSLPGLSPAELDASAGLPNLVGEASVFSGTRRLGTLTKFWLHNPGRVMAPGRRRSEL
jgi:hypothetical protein